MDSVKKITGDSLLKVLQERGYRITTARENVISALVKLRQPESIRSIAEQVDADEASVYRTIEMLLSEDLIESITLPDGTQTYALAGEHHHHIVCTHCNRVEHIECDEEGEEEHLRHPDFRAIFGHETTYRGICKKCA